MELPAIKLPQVELPFDIPLLMHPPVDHFIIVLPVIILLLEVVNLIVKKRAIGVTSFFLLILTVVAAAAAYLTGSVDGKEAYPLLSEVAQGELKEHKLLGTYLMLASAVVLVFKLLSVMINRGLMKALYLLILILFVAGIFKQGKGGGELVYTHGVNVKLVKIMDDEIFELKDELSDYKEEEAEEEAAAEEANKKGEAEKAAAEASEIKETPAKAAPATTEVKEPVAETVPETNTVPVETVSESVKASAEAVEEKVEVISQEAEKPQIATH